MEEDEREGEIEVNLEEIEDDEEEEEEKSAARGSLNLFVQENKGRGLADLETGSEVYLSEMLDFEFEDYEECDAQNEEDLLLLGDAFAEVELRSHVEQSLTEFAKKESDYMRGCLKMMLKEDQELAKKFLGIK